MLLAVILFVAFALLLAVIPFHTHAALLMSEAPASALALNFGVLCPTTLIAFAEMLTLSGLLPAIVQVTKVQDLLMGIGLVSTIGGTLLALGAADLRRLVAYSLIANLGSALAGLASLSGGRVIYPHATPEYFAEFAAHARNLGAKVIGGCCGTTPTEIAAIRRAIEEDRAPRAPLGIVERELVLHGVHYRKGPLLPLPFDYLGPPFLVGDLP